MALFEPSPIGNTDGHTHFVEMKAGKMIREGTWVYPDNRKGSIFIYKCSEDLMHFCWCDRTTLEMEDDFIIFPGDCRYFRVKQCTTGRVYVLKFENSAVRMFYWLQEPKTDKDDEHCRRINYYLNHPPTRTSIFPPFNIDQTQLSRIFGPEVAAQLSALMVNEENSRFADSEPVTDYKQNTTPLSKSNTSNDENKQQGIPTRRKSSLKSADLLSSTGNEKKQTKSVKILGDEKIENDRDQKDKKKNNKNDDATSSEEEENSDEDGSSNRDSA